MIVATFMLKTKNLKQFILATNICTKKIWLEIFLKLIIDGQFGKKTIKNIKTVVNI